MVVGVPGLCSSWTRLSGFLGGLGRFSDLGNSAWGGGGVLGSGRRLGGISGRGRRVGSILGGVGAVLLPLESDLLGEFDVVSGFVGETEGVLSSWGKAVDVLVSEVANTSGVSTSDGGNAAGFSVEARRVAECSAECFGSGSFSEPSVCSVGFTGSVFSDSSGGTGSSAGGSVSVSSEEKSNGESGRGGSSGGSSKASAMFGRESGCITASDTGAGSGTGGVSRLLGVSDS